MIGSAVVGQAIGQFSWTLLLYAVLSLTVLRMLPVYLSLTGTGLKPSAKLFVGWFGPRGLASIVFAIIVLGSDLPNAQFLAMVVVCTVILSVVAHEMTANPPVNRFGR
nr:cation:proton antiporter [Rhabdochromatium marinum]